MLEFRELSTEAKIGRVLILVGIILDIVSTFMIFQFGFYGSGIGLTLSGLFGRFAVILGVINLLGLALDIYAFRLSSTGNFYRAGICAVVASLLPPRDVIVLIGGLLCLISEEASRK